jgi:hypothetical protein
VATVSVASRLQATRVGNENAFNGNTILPILEHPGDGPGRLMR